MSSRQIRVSMPKLRHHCKPMSLCRQGRSASLFRNYVIIANLCLYVAKADPRLYSETTSSLQTYVSVSSRQIRVSIPKLRHHCKPMSLCRQGRSASLFRNYVITANLCLYVVKADPRLCSETTSSLQTYVSMSSRQIRVSIPKLRHHCKPMSLCRQGRSASLFRNYIITANLCLCVVKADPRLYSETTSSLQTYVSVSSRQIRVSIPKLRHHCKPMSLCRQGRSASLFRNYVITANLCLYVVKADPRLCSETTSSLQTYVSMSSRQIRVSIPKLRHHCKPMSLCRQGRSASLFRNYVIIANLCLYVVKADPRLCTKTMASQQNDVSVDVVKANQRLYAKQTSSQLNHSSVYVTSPHRN